MFYRLFYCLGNNKILCYKQTIGQIDWMCVFYLLLLLLFFCFWYLASIVQCQIMTIRSNDFRISNAKLTFVNKWPVRGDDGEIVQLSYRYTPVLHDWIYFVYLQFKCIKQKLNFIFSMFLLRPMFFLYTCSLCIIT